MDSNLSNHILYHIQYLDYNVYNMLLTTTTTTTANTTTTTSTSTVKLKIIDLKYQILIFYLGS